MASFVVIEIGTASRAELAAGKVCHAWVENAVDAQTATSQATQKRGEGRYAVTGAGALDIYGVTSSKTLTSTLEA